MAYLWRKLAPEQRSSLLAWRKQHGFPWHSPPHALGGRGTYLLTAACLNHVPHIGYSPDRMSRFCEALVATFAQLPSPIWAWCVLPNHYHLLVDVPDLREAIQALGRLHGRTSCHWNREEKVCGRQVWHAATDRFMRGERHFWATMNYIHHNPVRHGYVERWQEWPYSSATEFLTGLGRAAASRIWNDYPLRDYGNDWDEPWM